MATGRERDDARLSKSEPITLRRLLTRDAGPGRLDPHLVFLIEDIASTCRMIANRLRNAAFQANRGLAGDSTMQGEDQKMRDVIPEEIFGRVCESSLRLAGLVSEAHEDAVWIREPEGGDQIIKAIDSQQECFGHGSIFRKQVASRGGVGSARSPQEEVARE